MDRRAKSIGAALGLTAIAVLSPVMQGWWPGSSPKLVYYDYRDKADSVDATPGTIRYFAEAGSLTTDADSSAGAMEFGTFYNASNATLNMRVYNDTGPYGTGDSKYTLVQLYVQSAASDADQWSIPPGMRVKGIAVAVWAVTSGGLHYEVGRY